MVSMLIPLGYQAGHALLIRRISEENPVMSRAFSANPDRLSAAVGFSDNACLASLAS